MGRTVYAEDILLTYLTSLTEQDEYAIGLILGQSTQEKDYVVHLAKTPPPANKDVIEETIISSSTNVQAEAVSKYIRKVQDIPETWVADHAKHVTRMLPGGMWVIGIFIIGPEDSLSNNNSVQKLKTVVMAISKNLSSNKYLNGINGQESLILSFNSISKKFTCKSLEISTGGMLRPANWKFQAKATKWHQLEAWVDFDQLFPIEVDKTPETLKKQLQDVLKTISEMVDTAVVAIEGEARSPEDSVETVGKKKKDRKEMKSNVESNSPDKILQVDLYIPCSKNVSANVETISCSAIMRLVGQLVSRTFVHQKASVREAALAVKQDIVRSLASRLEMHWDSLIEEENGSPEENVTLHEPPRRVLVALPQSRVTLSDYLFPGEGPQEALVSLQELLDLEVQESSVEKELELQVDPAEFYCQNDVDTVPVDHTTDQAENHQFAVYITGLGVTFLILIAALVMNQLY